MIIDKLRGDDHYTVFPPSVHKSGEEYAWTPSEAEVTTVDYAVLKAAVTKLAIATALALNYPAEGTRNAAALAAGGMLAKVFSPDDVKLILVSAAEAAGDEEAVKRADSVDSTFEKLENQQAVQGAPTLGELIGKEAVQSIRNMVGAAAKIAEGGAGGAGVSESDDEDGEGGGVKKSQKARLFDIGNSAGHLFVDQFGKGYIALDIDSKRRLLPLEDRTFKKWLSHEYRRQADGFIPSTDAVNAAVVALQGQAEFGDCEKITLHNRFNRECNAILIDMGDGRAIRVTPDEVKVVSQDTVMFRQYPHQQALCTPAEKGDLRELLSFLNIKPENKHDQMLVLVWMVASLFGVPMPILMLTGTHGCAKTTAAKLIRSLLDPSTVPVLGLKKDPRELARIFDQHAIVVFDNMTHIERDVSDAICRAVTGEGFDVRKLYTDSESTLMSYRRPIVFTGISSPSAAADLTDRMLLVELGKITDAERKPEEILNKEFEDAKAGILAGLLKAAQDTLSVYQEVKPDSHKRMADFHRIGYAAAWALGYQPEDFERAMEKNHERQIMEHADDPVVQAVLKLLNTKGEFSGTMTKLYEELSSGRDRHRYDGWPGSSSSFGKRLRNMEPVLNGLDIDVVFPPGHKDGRRVELRRHQTPQPTPPSPSASASVPPALSPPTQAGAPVELPAKSVPVPPPAAPAAEEQQMSFGEAMEREIKGWD